MKKTRYHDMPKDEIREFVIMSSCRTLDEKIERAQEQEIDLELLKKRKSVQD